MECLQMPKCLTDNSGVYYITIGLRPFAMIVCGQIARAKAATDL